MYVCHFINKLVMAIIWFYKLSGSSYTHCHDKELADGWVTGICHHGKFCLKTGWEEYAVLKNLAESWHDGNNFPWVYRVFGDRLDYMGTREGSIALLPSVNKCRMYLISVSHNWKRASYREDTISMPRSYSCLPWLAPQGVL